MYNRVSVPIKMNTDAIENTCIFLEIPKTTNPMSVILSDLLASSVKIEYTAEKFSTSKIVFIELCD